MIDITLLLADTSNNPSGGIWSGHWFGLDSTWSAIYAASDAAVQGVLSVILNWISYQFSPAYMAQVALTMLSWFFKSVGAAIGGDVGTAMGDAGTVMDSSFLSTCWGVGLYMASPLIDATVVNLCCDALMSCWVFAMMFRMSFWVASIVWSAPS